MLHEGYKIWYTYKGVLCQYLDGVNYNFDKNLTLGTTLERCRTKYPDAVVWYEVVNVRPCNAPNGKVYRKCRCICDIKVVYHVPEKTVLSKPDPRNKPVAILTVRNDGDTIRMGRYTLIKSADGNYAVEGSEFVGTLEECTKYVEYVRQAPQCYKDRAVKCHNMNELIFRTDINGHCNTAFHTAQKMPQKAMSFHSRMAKGNRYAW